MIEDLFTMDILYLVVLGQVEQVAREMLQEEEAQKEIATTPSLRVFANYDEAWVAASFQWILHCFSGEADFQPPGKSAKMRSQSISRAGRQDEAWKATCLRLAGRRGKLALLLLTQTQTTQPF